MLLSNVFALSTRNESIRAIRGREKAATPAEFNESLGRVRILWRFYVAKTSTHYYKVSF